MKPRESENSLGDPERALALVYAPPDARPALRCLWLVDERLAAIVVDTSEAAIGEMRLLWWREALENLDTSIPAEPLLAEIATVLENVSHATSWSALAEGWHALLQEPIDETDLDRFARERGGRLFTLSANILGKEIDGIAAAGEAWALADLAARSSNAELSEMAAGMARNRLAHGKIGTWPSRLRSLGALVALARSDVAGDPRRRRQGSPARVARMAWHRLTGR